MGDSNRPTETSELSLPLAMMSRRLDAARIAGCGDEGHRDVLDALGDFTDFIRKLSKSVDRLPEAISERVNDDVLRLIDAHTKDAVILAVQNFVPHEQPVAVPAATPGWGEIARRFCATLAGSPWALVGIVGLFAISPSLRELARALVEAMR